MGILHFRRLHRKGPFTRLLIHNIACAKGAEINLLVLRVNTERCPAVQNGNILQPVDVIFEVFRIRHLVHAAFSVKLDNDVIAQRADVAVRRHGFNFYV